MAGRKKEIGKSEGRMMIDVGNQRARRLEKSKTEARK
jgi:hypothetical protein